MQISIMWQSLNLDRFLSGLFFSQRFLILVPSQLFTQLTPFTRRYFQKAMILNIADVANNGSASEIIIASLLADVLKSYVFYSYVLSTILVATIAINYPLLLNIAHLELVHAISLVGGLISGLYFMIFTAGLLSGSFRSITLGIYTVDQIKKIKTPQFTNSEIRRMWFSSAGRSKLFKSFRANWKHMVGQQASVWQVLFVF